MRSLFLLTVSSLLLACHAPASSLTPCGLDDACPVPEEACWVSQVCIGAEEGRDEPACGEVTGSQTCHRTCEADPDCAPEERCLVVTVSARSDVAEDLSICVLRESSHMEA